MFSRLNLIVCIDNHCIPNASCESRDPCVFPGQIWHQLIFPEVSIGHSICTAYVIGEHAFFWCNYKSIEQHVFVAFLTLMYVPYFK